MNIVKYCKSEHNPLNGCSSIQLGTLKYYREMDPTFSIADDEEGLVSFGNESRRIYANAIVSTNTYIFCLSTSILSEQEISSQLDSAYNSAYYVRAVQSLALTLGAALREQLTLDDFEEHSRDVLEQCGGLSAIRIMVYKALVAYSDSALEIPDELAENFNPGDITIYLSNLFTKRKNYKNDEEYRFIFLLDAARDGATVAALEIKKPPKIVLFPPGMQWNCLSRTRVEALIDS